MKNKLDYSKIKLDLAKPELIFMQLADELQRLIEEASCDSSITLLSSRKLAGLLKINRVTVGKAYKELLRREVIEPKSKLFYRVSAKRIEVGNMPCSSIGIFLPFRFSELIEQYYGMPLQYIKGIMDAAQENSLSILMLELPPLDASQKEIDSYNSNLVKKVIGAVHLGIRQSNGIIDQVLETVMKNKALPQVLIAAYTKFENIGMALFDETSGALALAEQLCAMHHKKVGFLLETPSFDYAADRNFTYAAWRRGEKIREILRKYGIPCEEKYSVFCCRTYGEIKNALLKMINSQDMPTVFLCHNDLIALRCIKVIREFGLRVPEDVSVIGFDGIAAFDKENELTTIALPFYAIGRDVVRMLLDYWKNGISEKNRISYRQTFLISQKTLFYAKKEGENS